MPNRSWSIVHPYSFILFIGISFNYEQFDCDDDDDDCFEQPQEHRRSTTEKLMMMIFCYRVNHTRIQAIAKMTTQCALYMGALKISRVPEYAHGY